jgi:hypothetical protein
VIHEEHEAKDGADEPTNIGEELIYLVERPFVGDLRAGFDKVKLGISSTENQAR